MCSVEICCPSCFRSRSRLKLLLPLAGAVIRGGMERAGNVELSSFLSPSRGDAVRGVNLVVFPSDVLTDRCLLAGENNGVYAELRKKGAGS